MPVALPRSLFARNIALLIFLVVVSQVSSLSVLMHYVQRPRVERAAETFAIYVQTLDELLRATPPEARGAIAAQLEASRELPAGANVTDPVPNLHDFYRTLQRKVFLAALRRHLPPDMTVRWQADGEQRLWIHAHLGQEPYWIALPVPDAAHNDGMTFALLLSLGLGVLAIITAYVIQRVINRPLRELADAARGLSAGVAPKPLRVDGPTEIAQVSVAFNQMAQALQEADATRSLMLAGISHDIRTPLTKLRLAVAMSSPSDEHTLAVSTDHYLDQIDAILQQFMDYAGSGTREASEMGDLNALVSNLAADFAGLGHVFELSLGEVRPFMFRPISVMRILMNLMQNAVVYAGVGLSVRTWADDAVGMAYVEIADRGKGVDAGDLEALKAPFKRGRSTTGLHPGGTGLGLAIVERIAKLHGGGLQLSQRNEGGLAAVVSLSLTEDTRSRGAG